MTVNRILCIKCASFAVFRAQLFTFISDLLNVKHCHWCWLVKSRLLITTTHKKLTFEKYLKFYFEYDKTAICTYIYYILTTRYIDEQRKTKIAHLSLKKKKKQRLKRVGEKIITEIIKVAIVCTAEE